MVKMLNFNKLKEAFSHAFSVEDDYVPSKEDHALLEKIAHFIVKRGLYTPAMMVIESSRPVSFISSQILHFVNPIVASVLSKLEIERLAQIFEHRKSIDLLLDKLDSAEKQLSQNRT